MGHLTQGTRQQVQPLVLVASSGCEAMSAEIGPNPVHRKHTELGQWRSGWLPSDRGLPFVPQLNSPLKTIITLRSRGHGDHIAKEKKEREETKDKSIWILALTKCLDSCKTQMEIWPFPLKVEFLSGLQVFETPSASTSKVCGHHINP